MKPQNKNNEGLILILFLALLLLVLHFADRIDGKPPCDKVRQVKLYRTASCIIMQTGYVYAIEYKGIVQVNGDILVKD